MTKIALFREEAEQILRELRAMEWVRLNDGPTCCLSCNSSNYSHASICPLDAAIKLLKERME